MDSVTRQPAGLVRYATVKDRTGTHVVELPRPLRPSAAHAWIRQRFGSAAYWLSVDRPEAKP